MFYSKLDLWWILWTSTLHFSFSLRERMLVPRKYSVKGKQETTLFFKHKPRQTIEMKESLKTRATFFIKKYIVRPSVAQILYRWSNSTRLLRRICLNLLNIIFKPLQDVVVPINLLIEYVNEIFFLQIYISFVKQVIWFFVLLRFFFWV